MLWHNNVVWIIYKRKWTNLDQKENLELFAFEKRITEQILDASRFFFIAVQICMNGMIQFADPSSKDSCTVFPYAARPVIAPFFFSGMSTVISTARITGHVFYRLTTGRKIFISVNFKHPMLAECCCICVFLCTYVTYWRNGALTCLMAIVVHEYRKKASFSSSQNKPHL